MDLEKQSVTTTQSALHQMKENLKQWEHNFRRQHSRPPSKDDVQACDSIYQLYREYARLKKKLEKERTSTETKIHVTTYPRELVGEEVTNSDVVPLERDRLFPPQPSSPSNDSSGSHISSTPPKPVSIKRELQLGVAPSSCLRRPLQSLSPNICNTMPAQRNSDAISSTRMDESSSLKGKTASKTVIAAPSHQELLSTCPLVLEGLVIRFQRHGSLLNNRQRSLPDDSLPAGFFSSCGPSSLVRKDVEVCSIISDEGANIEDYDCANLDLVNTVATMGDKYLNKQGALANTAERAGVVFNQPQCVDVTHDTQISTPLSAVGIGCLANVNSDGPTDSAANKEDKRGETICNRGDLSLDLQKTTVVGLKKMLLEHGLPLAGNKCTLIRRLEEAFSTGKKAGQPSTAENMDAKFHELGQGDLSLDLQKTTVVGLKKMLLEHGLPLAGNKCTLIRRLEEAFSTEKKAAQPSTAENIDVKFHELGQAREGTTSARHTQSLKRKLDDEGHELLPKDISNKGNVKSVNPTKKYTLRSKESPSALQLETEFAKVGTYSEIVTPETSSQGGGRQVSVVKPSTKRVKVSEPLEENSWAHPRMLRKGTRVQKRRSQAPSKSRPRPCLKPGERDNFVRLNINGKGGKGRRFVNGTRTKRPGAYGRRGTHGAKFRKKGFTKNAANGVLDHEGNEIHQEGDGELARSSAGHRATSLWANDGWLEKNSCPEGLVDSIGKCTDEFTAGLRNVVEKAKKSPADENLMELLRVVFGFKYFRTGQLETIKRILSLQSTMVTLPTGAGKSLCYQLPAHLLPGITLVISPLIALMADQLSHLPPSLPGALISSAQTPQESSATISRLRAGQVKVLFISPERLLSESFLSILGELPKISLAVIDEAHCLSEWSHNFRPSYFILGKVLHQRMKVPCVLAMTATATKKAEQSILKALCIPAAGLVQAFHLRQNLSLSVSRRMNRLQSLLSLLQSSPYAEAKSIIIYCTFQVETDYISGFLEQNGIQAKSYHAKKTSQERNRIYDLFCRNKLRVVVATVAFGMGLDKSDVRAIVHYNMPRSLEHYVQETGRAGRDGNPAYCHLFLDDGDFLKLRSLAYSDGVDEYSVNKFLCRVFNGSSASRIPGNLGSIIIDTTSKELDMKEQVMETILSLLEVGEVEYVNVLSKLNATCTLSFHQSNPASLAGRNIFVAAVRSGSKEQQGRYVFDIPSIATYLQWSLFQVQAELRRLQAAGEITYEVGDSALCFSVLEIPVDICLLTSKITKHLAEVEQCQVRKLDAMYSAASAAVRNMNWAAPQESDVTISSQQASLQSCIKFYFEKEEDLPHSENVPTCIQSERSFVRADIKVFLKSARNPMLTGRAVARIFHGMWSPAFPYAEWSKSHFWGQHARVDFQIIKEAAAGEILLQHTTSRDDFQL